MELEIIRSVVKTSQRDVLKGLLDAGVINSAAYQSAISKLDKKAEISAKAAKTRARTEERKQLNMALATNAISVEDYMRRYKELREEQELEFLKEAIGVK